MVTSLQRQSWLGAKKYVKTVLGAPGVSQVAHAVVQRAMPARGAERLPVPWNVRSVVGRVPGAEFTMLHPARCVVAKELYWGKGRRPGAADALALDTFARLAPGADLIMDIGAYTGIFTLIGALCSPQAEVRAYEIVPANYLAAWRNLVANDLVQPRIDLQLRGVGRADTTVTVPTGEGGSALPDFYSLDLELKSGVNVPVISLDSLVGDRVPKQVLIKIDVEGNEDDIFAEGGEFLSAYRPDLLCEILAEEANLPAVRRQLSGLGYRYFLVADGQLVEFAEIFGDRLHRDWLITTKSPDDLGNLAIPAVSNL